MDQATMDMSESGSTAQGNQSQSKTSEEGRNSERVRKS
jgi:hypothetical protein